MIECVVGCSIPSMGVIAEVGEFRDETPERAERLANTGRFRIVKGFIPIEIHVAGEEIAAPVVEVIAGKTLADVVGDKHVEALAVMGIRTVDDLLKASKQSIADSITGVGNATVTKWLKAAKE